MTVLSPRLRWTLFLAGAVHPLLYFAFRLSYFVTEDAASGTIPLIEAFARALRAGATPLWNPESFLGMKLLGGGSIDLKVQFLSVLVGPIAAIVAVQSAYLYVALFGFAWMSKGLTQCRDEAIALGSVFFAFNGFSLWWGYETVFSTIYLTMPLMIALLRERGLPVTLRIGGLWLLGMDRVATSRWDSIEIAFVGIIAFVAVAEWTQTRALPLVHRLAQVARATGTKAAILLATHAVAAASLPFLMREQYDLISNSSRVAAKMPSALYPTAWVNFLVQILGSEGLDLSRGIGAAGWVGTVNLLLLSMSLLQGRRALALAFFFGAVFWNLFVLDVRFHGIQLFELYKLLPGHASIEYSIRFLPLFFLFLAIPVQEGVDSFLRLSESRDSRLRVARQVFLAASVFKAALFLWLVTTGSPRLSPVNREGLLASLFLIESVILLFVAKNAWDPRSVVQTLIATTLATTYLTNYVNAPSAVPSHHYDRLFRSERSREVADALADLSHYRSGRVMALGSAAFDLNPIFTFEGVPTIGGYHAMVKADVARYFRDLLGASFHARLAIFSPPVFGAAYLAGVAYWLVSAEESALVNDERLTFDRAIGDFLVYRSSQVLPILHLTQQVVWARPSEVFQLLRKQMDSDSSWFKDHTVLTGDPVSGWALGKEQGQAWIRSYRADRVEVEALSPSGSVLVLSDYFDASSWTARLDGATTPIYKANGIFRGVYLPPGRHWLEFAYNPSTYWAITLSAVLLALGLIGHGLLNRARFAKAVARVSAL